MMSLQRLFARVGPLRTIISHLDDPKLHQKTVIAKIPPSEQYPRSKHTTSASVYFTPALPSALSRGQPPFTFPIPEW